MSHSSRMSFFFFFYSEKRTIGYSEIYLSNGIIFIVAQQDPTIDRSFVHIIIFTQCDAVHVRRTCSPYFSQTTIVKKGGGNKLSNEIGCIIDYQHVHMFKETSNFILFFFSVVQ